MGKPALSATDRLILWPKPFSKFGSFQNVVNIVTTIADIHCVLIMGQWLSWFFTSIIPFHPLNPRRCIVVPTLFCCCLVTRSCPTLCNPMDCSLSGSTVHGILQANVLEWVSMPSPGNLPNPVIKPRSPTLQVDSLPVETPGKNREVNWLTQDHTLVSSTVGF